MVSFIRLAMIMFSLHSNRTVTKTSNYRSGTIMPNKRKRSPVLMELTVQWLDKYLIIHIINGYGGEVESKL